MYIFFFKNIKTTGPWFGAFPNITIIYDGQTFSEQNPRSETENINLERFFIQPSRI